jgi:hypothetical protein
MFRRTVGLVKVKAKGLAFVRGGAASDRLDCGAHAAGTAKHAVRHFDDAGVGCRSGRGPPQRARDFGLVPLGIKRTNRNKCPGRGAADPGKTMKNYRCATIPAAHETNELGDVLLAGQGVAVKRHGNIIDREDQMVFGRNCVWSLHQVYFVEQRDDVPSPASRNRLVKPCQRADVNHDSSTLEPSCTFARANGGESWVANPGALAPI